MNETQADTASNPDAPEPEAETTEPTDTVDHQAEAEKWKAQARKHEERAKQNAKAAKELEQVRAAAMSDTEKAAATARAEGRAEAFREAGSRMVDAEVRAAAAGKQIDVDALLEGVDRTRFLDDDGEPNVTAIRAWVEKVSPKVEQDEKPEGFPDLGQGVRTNTDDGLGSDPLYQKLKNIVGVQ